jgi:predicted component of type VI protein secretion system
MFEFLKNSGSIAAQSARAIGVVALVLVMFALPAASLWKAWVAIEDQRYDDMALLVILGAMSVMMLARFVHHAGEALSKDGK